MNTTQYTALLAGGTQLLLALTVWAVVSRRPARLPVTLWVVGSIAMSLGVLVFVARAQLPTWASFHLAAALMGAAMLLRTVALRIDTGRPSLWRQALVLWAVCVLAYSVNLHLQGAAGNRTLALLQVIGLTLLLSGQAWLAARLLRSSMARVVALVEALFAATILLRLASLSLGWTPPGQLSASWDALLMATVAVAEALFGNLGYLGMELQRSQAAQRQAEAARLAEVAHREAAERSAEDLRGLLQQRDRLASERNHLLHVLAHEVKQPLHNTGGALQAAAIALQEDGPEARQQVALRLQRAQALLGDVQSMLDNTLAVSSMLVRTAPVALQEVDLDYIADLALGDLSEVDRSRVSIRWHDQLRSAELEPNLVRLALRNLLRNAFRHGGPGVQVTLDIAEQADPPALLLTVSDDGPGAPDSLWQKVTSLPQADSADDRPERGLGLFIVRRVMALHQGRLTLRPAQPHGLVAQLSFPQGRLDVVPATPPAALAASHREPSGGAPGLPQTATLQARFSGALKS